MNAVLQPNPMEETATLAGGCFWCLAAVFDELQGVAAVVSGYMGGALANPTYQQVCGGATGHAEVVNITFDPQVMSFTEILQVFFAIHDPTTLNRQGDDAGAQYRSAIFYHTPEQKDAAGQIIAELEAAKIWDDPVVTQVVPATTFYAAENHHQKYFHHNAYHPYCQVVIAPKLAKFRKQFGGKLKR